MALRDRISKAFGFGSEATSPDIVAVTELALEQNQMINEPFSPGMPLRPYSGYSGTPRSRDFITGTNISSRPRLNEQVSFSTLKGLVNNYDIAQMCIWHRIDSVRSMKWHLVPVDDYNGETDEFVRIGMQALKKPDREFPFKTWLAKYLFDILAFDAGTLYKMRNNAGQPIGLRVLDGTTIAPLLDYYGNRPTGKAPAFVQFAQGVPWEWLTSDDIIYEPFRPQSDSMYGKAPLETLLLNANTDLRFQQFFLNHFTEGNVPEGFASAPEGWTPQQIEDFQDQWDAIMYGDDTQKSQVKWVPFGTKFDWSNDSKFDDQFSLFLMRKTAAMFHVTPADLGFTEDVNRASGETQADVQFRVGDLPLMEHVGGIITNFLQDDLLLPLEFQWDTGREIEDRLATAQADKIYVELGAISSSEVREKVYGLDEPDGQKVPRYIMTARSGPVPLSALYAVAGEIDPESAAPLPGAALPHKPFAPIEGVTPQKAPDQPPLAVQRYPADNPASVAAAAIADAAPVLKTGAGPGITSTSGTVATSSPLMADGNRRKSDSELDAESGNRDADIPEDAEVQKGINSGHGNNASPLIASAQSAPTINLPKLKDIDDDDDKKRARDAARSNAAIAEVTKRQHHADGKFIATGQKQFTDDPLTPEETLLGDEDPVAKAAEDRAFRSFVRGRVKAGRWRDFEFHHDFGKSAQERNRSGRVEVAKAGIEEVGEANPIAAGLCVIAEDTGRVLMLQRAYDLNDPASGKWEFPGGHIEEGEDAFDAAVREFVEETGCPPPWPAVLWSQWTSRSGLYQGIIIKVPFEAQIEINLPAEQRITTDPDGDGVETCAWWDLYAIQNNGAVRDELSADADLVLFMIEEPDKPILKAAQQSAWAGHAMHKVERPLMEHHAPKVQEGIQAMVTKTQIQAMVEKYLSTKKD